MVDPESVQDYTPPSPRVQEVDGDVLDVYCGEDLPPIGAAIRLEHPEDEQTAIHAVVRRHLGARRAEAWLPVRPDWVRQDLDVEPTDRPAALRADSSLIVPGPDALGPADSGDVPVWPSPPEYDEISGRTTLLPVDIEAVDALSPICESGLNLVVDNTGQADGFFELARRAALELEPDRLLAAGRRHPDRSPWPDDSPDWAIEAGDSIRSQIAALQFVIALSPRLREADQSLAVVELPDLRAPSPTSTSSGRGVRDRVADVVNRLGRHLVSTDESQLTALLLLSPPQDHPGLSAVLDSLELGDADATVFIDDEGRFDPDRSRSTAELDDRRRSDRDRFQQVIQLAGDAEEKSAIFGDQELTEKEREALEVVEQTRPFIGNSA